MPSSDAPLASLLTSKATAQTRHDIAALLGQGGLAAADRTKVEALLKDPALVHDAAIALLFGGDSSSVAKVFAAYEPKEGDDAPPAPPLDALQRLYTQSLPELGDELYGSGTLVRMANLAVAARSATLRGAKQEWVLQAFAYQLRERGAMDAGPHTMTRVRLRATLLADARGSDVQKRDDALLLLWVLGEHASLLSLGDVAHARLAESSP
jgi:hypothetical protein